MSRSSPLFLFVASCWNDSRDTPSLLIGADIEWSIVARHFEIACALNFRGLPRAVVCDRAFPIRRRQSAVDRTASQLLRRQRRPYFQIESKFRHRDFPQGMRR